MQAELKKIIFKGNNFFLFFSSYLIYIYKQMVFWDA